MAASATAEAKEAAALAVEAAAVKPVQQTSLASRGIPPGEVTVQFRRWTAHAQTAYQRGQFAGFPLVIAERLEAAGAVNIDPGYRREPLSNRMIRK
jgi:hypothetical protein